MPETLTIHEENTEIVSFEDYWKSHLSKNPEKDPLNGPPTPWFVRFLGGPIWEPEKDEKGWEGTFLGPWGSVG